MDDLLPDLHWLKASLTPSLFGNFGFNFISAANVSVLFCSKAH